MNWDAEQLASERTLLAAERTFSAWIRTGITSIGGGLAVARGLAFNLETALGSPAAACN